MTALPRFKSCVEGRITTAHLFPVPWLFFDRMFFTPLVTVFLLYAASAQGSEVEIGCGVYRFEAIHRVEPADDGVGILIST